MGAFHSRHDYFLRKRDPVVCHHTLSVLMRVVDDLRSGGGKTLPSICHFDAYFSRGAVNKALLSRLVDVVYRLICDGELKLATVLRRSLIQKVDLSPRGRGRVVIILSS